MVSRNMEFEYFSKNSELRPIAEAVIPLGNIEYQYGFGVYESLRVVNGIVYFLDEHAERLMESARIIGLMHSFTLEDVGRAVTELAEKTGAGTYNLKILLIGGAEPQLIILPLNPHFPDKKLYRDGVHTVTYEYERAFPHAKSLNMLQSYLAYKKAKEVGAYDALLIDREGHITEGTRTNFFCMKGNTLYSPPEEKILPGVTRKIVLKVAKEHGFEVAEKNIRPQDLSEYEAAFLTSTSSGIMPIASVEEFKFGSQPEALKELSGAFDNFVKNCGGKIE
jgi:branched-subunit amino acid aminotransferase/4-amino-4-deoxychorismate lyase